MGNTHPLESLAAFAICFVAGIVTTVGLGAYISKLKRDGQKTEPHFDKHGREEGNLARETT